MNRDEIIHDLTVQLAAKQCDGTPEGIVSKYFELLSEVKAQYDAQKKLQPVAKARTFTMY